MGSPQPEGLQEEAALWVVVIAGKQTIWIFEFLFCSRTSPRRTLRFGAQFDLNLDHSYLGDILYIDAVRITLWVAQSRQLTAKI